jgi:hypothetical protein
MKPTAHTKLFKLFFTVNLLLSPLALAQTNTSKPLADESIAYLKNLEQSASCEITSVYDLIQDQIQDYDIIDNFLATIHADLQTAFRKESVKTIVCLTPNNLIKVDATDHTSVLVNQDKLGNQIAIRLENTIFIQKALFAKVPVDQKKYLITLEMAHGLLGLSEIQMRYLKVNSFVINLKKMIEANDLRESRFATLIKNSEFKGIPLFSGEKTCGVLQADVYSLEQAKENCFKLLGAYAYINSSSPDVVYSKGDYRSVSASVGSSYYYNSKYEKVPYVRLWIDRNTYFDLPNQYINVKTLDQYFEIKKQEGQK